MTWDAYNRRRSTLREAMTLADKRRDGTLPWADLADTADLRSPDELLLEMQLTWRTRLAGRVETATHDQPDDLEAAVARAWRQNAADMPGVRAVLDAHDAHPALAAARDKELRFLGSAAGYASADDPSAPAYGLRVRARAQAISLDTRRPAGYRRSMVNRLRSALAV